VLNSKYDVIIAGAGPAGTSAAIHLAMANFSVLLVEQKEFPRHKLCGEFISPECQSHFTRLGVAKEIVAALPTSIEETIFYSRRGQHVSVPSRWFGGEVALGLSRSVMDNVLLTRAGSCGVQVLERATVSDLLKGDERVEGVRVKQDGVESEYRSTITLDATGRGRALARRVQTDNSARKKPRLIAFKTHLKNTRVAAGACEIYFYPGGYGGLSTVDGEVSNLCFIVGADDVKRCHSDPNRVMREVLMLNPRAAQTLENSDLSTSWLSASWESFGRRSPNPAVGLLSIGDSAAFIDPFTGSGMLMALQSGELAASTIVRSGNKSLSAINLEDLGNEYQRLYRQTFGARLRLCSLLRTFAFSPGIVQGAIMFLGGRERLLNLLARATRAGGAEKLTSPRVG
jgi:menaquinone-9 beta-reductase